MKPGTLVSLISHAPEKDRIFCWYTQKFEPKFVADQLPINTVGMYIGLWGISNSLNYYKVLIKKRIYLFTIEQFKTHDITIE